MLITMMETLRLLNLIGKQIRKIEVLDNIEDEPLSCSPNGNLCLYGYRLDKIIDVKSHKMVRIFTPA